MTQTTAQPQRARLLLVDDQPINIRLYHSIFAEEHELFMARSGEQALEQCLRAAPDLLLCDVVMPGMDGLELCRRMKQLPELRDIPVIFVSALQSTDDETACWEAGGSDFVNKPVNPITLQRRVSAHLAMKRQADQLRQMAFIDGLTGVANRRHFDQRFDAEWRRSQRNGATISLLLLDVDFFKRYNDRYGHPAGDACLQRVAGVLQAALNRPADLAARYGGEEFVCLLPETEAAGALPIAQHLLDAVRELGIEHLASEVGPVITVSIGLASHQPDLNDSASELIARADFQLYHAKQQGRDRICSE